MFGMDADAAAVAAEAFESSGAIQPLQQGHRVQRQRGMSFRQNEAVAIRVAGAAIRST